MEGFQHSSEESGCPDELDTFLSREISEKDGNLCKNILHMAGKKKLLTGIALFLVKSLLVVAFIFGTRKQASPPLNLQAEPVDLSSSTMKLKLTREQTMGMVYTDRASSDLITTLPGLTSAPNFLQFSGYLDVSESKHNFYWFTESENDPLNDPLMIWTNGGPGCSGFIGFMGEMGPFRPQADLSLLPNNMAWNKLANMVYIEQPCGVGFSYSDNPNFDYHASDSSAAEDNLQLVLQFLQRFPHLKKNKLYLSGESYGGHYLPTWALQIVQHNERAGNDGLINFAGFLVGNPYTNPIENGIGMVGTFWGHQLLPYDMFEKWIDLGCKNFREPSFAPCMDLSTEMFSLIDDMDPYALDYDVCLKNEAQAVGMAQRDRLTSYIQDGRFQSKKSKFVMQNLMVKESEDLMSNSTEYLLADFQMLDTSTGPTYQPCSSDYMKQWINQDSVKEAIHANTNLQWLECSTKLHYHRMDQQTPMDPLYQTLISKNLGLNIMVFSGDDDSICGTIGTQSWIWNLGYPTTKKWGPWRHNGQVAGFEQRFQGLRFATVHGAGHEVPAFKPGPSLQLLQAFLDGTDLDDLNQ